MSVDINELFSCFEETTEEVTPLTVKEGLKRTQSTEIDVSDTKRQKTEDICFEDVNIDEFSNRISIQIIDCLDECTHEVAYPSDQECVPLKHPETAPAKTYSFNLDPFQKESILCIDNNQSVLVSAHTSAGKTVVAEYAIAISLRDKQRVIYTTPIKALSNQKYREFLNEFKDVGLMTGDVTINPTASCLVMTTEILRNMLYRGSEIMREVGWVVFDEIHYMRDKERGVVWEETLILLPHNVHYVFLSATIPNARQFAEWVAHIHQQPCHVIYTEYRPTPLEHHIFPVGGEGLHLIVDQNGAFIDENFNKAMSCVQSSTDTESENQNARKHGTFDKTQSDICELLKYLITRNQYPIIVFSFSKRLCDEHASKLTEFGLNSSKEDKLVEEVWNNAIDVLNEEDKQLPQVINTLPLLRRGIGVHHSGLLPILKETTEILFGEGLIKVLFATETFAMGLNMPARTVIFTGINKFDGTTTRWITSGEYIQMSGRAGRRGLDDKGTVILMVNKKVPPSIGRDIIKGQANQLNSAFHLTYSMVLNLMRVEEINPEYMLERSFYQYQNQATIPTLHKKYTSLLDEYKQLLNDNKEENEAEIASYYKIDQKIKNLTNQSRSYINNPKYIKLFLNLGRFVKIKNGEDEFDWGIITGAKEIKRTVGKIKNQETNKYENDVQIKYDIDVLVRVEPTEPTLNENEDDVFPKPCSDGSEGELKVVTVDTSLITHVSKEGVFFVQVITDVGRKYAYKAMRKILDERPNGPKLLDPVKDMKITEEPFLKILERIEVLQKKLSDHSLHESIHLKQLYADYHKKSLLKARLEEALKQLKDAKSVLQLDELKCRKRVLRRLGYCSKTDVINLKGRVACELNSGDELLLTEMIFNGVFNDLTPAMATAVLSCFVCDERTNDPPKIDDKLSTPLRQMQDIARRIAKVTNECRIELKEYEYVEKFKPHLMNVVFAWCNGSSFKKICRMTKIFEGSIIRCIRRLADLLTQMVQASKTIGNTNLEDKFNSAIKLIKRDVIFASSLYL